MTLNADGTYSVITTFKKGFKKVFDHEERTSGKWHLKDGTLTLTATAATERPKIGQVYSFRITSVNESEVLYVDNATGQRRVEWKLR